MADAVLALHAKKSTNVRHSVPLGVRTLLAGLRGLSFIAPGVAARLAWRLWTSPTRVRFIFAASGSTMRRAPSATNIAIQRSASSFSSTICYPNSPRPKTCSHRP